MRFYSSTDKRANLDESQKKYQWKHHKSPSNPIRTWKSIIRRFHKDFDLHTFSNKLPYEFLTETNPMRKTNFEKMPSLTKFKLGALEKKKKSFALIRKSLNSTEVFYPDDEKNAQRWQSDTNWRGKTLMCERVWCHEITIPCYATVPVLVEFVWFVVNCLWNLSVSLFLCAKIDFGCSWFVI